jgi:serine/threonine protein kinase
MQAPFSAGYVLRGRYGVQSVLGQGGMGRTYLARDMERFNEFCVLKEFIPPNQSPEVVAKAQELFQREASVLYQIRHPQVPEFRATFEAEGRLLLVQDYVEGKTFRALLNERLQQRQLFTEAEIVNLLHQILPILAYIHSHNIIHRDLSPENLMLRTKDRLPVLIDFGVVHATANLLTSQMGLPASTVAGKAGYAPPEQLQTGSAYPNSDLYALAVTCLVLLTGKEPPELFDSINLTWQWQRYTSLSPSLAQVLERMLSYRPTHRYGSAAEVIQALQMAQAAYSSVKTIAVGQQLDPAQMPPIPQRTVLAGDQGQPQPRNNPANTPPSPNYQNNYPPNAPISQESGVNWFLALFLLLAAGGIAWSVTALFMPNRNASKEPVSTPVAATSTPTATPTTKATPVKTNRKLDLQPTGDGRKGSAKDTVESGQIITYRFDAEADETVKIALYDGTDLQMSITAEDGGQPINGRAKDNTSGYWQGTIKRSGAYFIAIKTNAKQSGFTLDVTVTTPPKPTPTPTPTATASPTTKPTPSPTPTDVPPETQGGSRKVRSEFLEIPPGQAGTPVDDAVNPNEVVRYSINAIEGKPLSIEVKGDVEVRVTGPSGEELATLQNGSQQTFPTQVTGRYKISVSGRGPKATPFTLGISNK